MISFGQFVPIMMWLMRFQLKASNILWSLSYVELGSAVNVNPLLYYSLAIHLLWSPAIQGHANESHH